MLTSRDTVLLNTTRPAALNELTHQRASERQSERERERKRESKRERERPETWHPATFKIIKHYTIQQIIS